ncbi:hypothetical protein GCM10027423_62780 [Spirosoma arcticum]
MTSEKLTDLYPSTDREVFDAKAPTSSTLISSMVVQSTYKEAGIEGYRYEYRYYYDADNRLAKLDYQGYLHKYIRTPETYTNFIHRVVTITYSSSGELAAIQMNGYDQQGQPTNYFLNFPVRKENGELVVYGQSQFYPNPFADQPIMRISDKGRVLALPCPWNDPAVSQFAQFALNTFSYDAADNLKSITFSYVDPTRTKQQAPLLTQIQHSRYVLNPFGRDPAYGAVHLLARGGYSTSLPSTLDFSQNMVLTDQVERWTRSENGFDYGHEGPAQTNYTYRYNSHRLPTWVKRTQSSKFNPVSVDSVTFTY